MNKASVHDCELFRNARKVTLPTVTCSKLTIETLEHGVRYVQS